MPLDFMYDSSWLGISAKVSLAYIAGEEQCMASGQHTVHTHTLHTHAQTHTHTCTHTHH